MGHGNKPPHHTPHNLCPCLLHIYLSTYISLFGYISLCALNKRHTCSFRIVHKEHILITNIIITIQLQLEDPYLRAIMYSLCTNYLNCQLQKVVQSLKKKKMLSQASGSRHATHALDGMTPAETHRTVCLQALCSLNFVIIHQQNPSIIEDVLVGRCSLFLQTEVPEHT